MYYNTTSIKGELLKAYEAKSKTQNEKVLKIVQDHGSYGVSASAIFYFMTAPITSIRRALNTLEKEGKIRKSGTQRTGMYGRYENNYVAI